tara:strand:- start:143115 stop:143723 length:609 start_codon:yes stop_codon:yes gene_type:complete
MTQNNLHEFSYDHSKEEIARKFGKGSVVWMVGLSGSGKSTIANEILKKLSILKERVIILDGDTFRKGLNSDLSFSIEDRSENLRRVSHVAKLFSDQGYIVICAFISPLSKHRRVAREVIGESFLECYIDVSVEECEKRDPKGLYSKARAGEIPDFTGVSSPFEIPERPELRLEMTMTADVASQLVVDFLKDNCSDVFIDSLS